MEEGPEKNGELVLLSFFLSQPFTFHVLFSRLFFQC